MFTFFLLGYRGIGIFVDLVLASWSLHIGDLLYFGSGYVCLRDVSFCITLFLLIG